MSALAFAQLSLLWNCLCGTLRDKWRLWDNTGLLSSSPLSSQLRVKVPLSSETCPFPFLTAKETDCSCQGFRNCSLWMVQEIKLCFGTSLRKLWGSCLGGNQPKQRVRRGWGWGEVVWSNIESHHWLLWTRAIRWSPLFVSCVNWIPFTFCLLESDKPSTQQGCGQPFLSWMTSWSSCGVGAEEGDLKGGGLCIPLSAVLKGLYWLGSRGCCSRGFALFAIESWEPLKKDYPTPFHTQNLGKDLARISDLETVKIQLLFGSSLPGKCELSVLDYVALITSGCSLLEAAPFPRNLFCFSSLAVCGASASCLSPPSPSPFPPHPVYHSSSSLLAEEMTWP